MDYTVAAVDEALGLLAIVAAEGGLGVSELARRSGNTKARSYRLLLTLEGRGFVERYGDPAVYRLGSQSLLVGLAAQAQISVVSQARRHLDYLASKFDETVHVRIRDGLDSVCVAFKESTRDVRVNTYVGKRRNLHAGSSGKVLLAFAPEDVVRQVLSSDLKKFTATTLVSKTKLSQELEQVRSRGFATSLAEVTPDIHSAAAPIRDSSGSVVASIGLSVPAGRAGEKVMSAFVDTILDRAALLSAELGYRPAK